MATVTVVTAERTLEIEASSITAGTINTAGHLILTRHDGQTIDAGAISGMQIHNGTSYVKADTFAYVGGTDPGSVPDGSVWYDVNEPAGPFASDVQKGLVELADSTETIAGTDTTRAVTPAGLASLTSTTSRRGLVELSSSTGTVTGTDTTRAVTPSGLTAALAAYPVGKSLGSNTIAQTALPAAYPVGISYMSLTSGSGWTPNSGFGSVITFNVSDNRCTQHFYASAGGTTLLQAWVRHHNTADGGGGWTSWQKIADQDISTIADLAPVDNDILQRKSGAWINRTMAQLATDLAATGEFPDIRLHNGTSYVDADTAHVYIGPSDPGAVSNGSVWFDTTP